ncbi:MAG: protein arginine kinase [Phycisphaerales bacterium]|nr:protein arginine kinase [Planctomycetota bacterium]MCH8507518.1 protein arginine kinase [Phycisphaerales bacterium]
MKEPDHSQQPAEGTPTPPRVFERGTEWLRGQGDASDVVLSSRVRVARNLAGFPFMTTASRTDRSQILDLCRRRLLGVPVGESRRVLWVDLHTASHDERDLLVERQLISRNHAKGKLSNGAGGADEPRGVAVVLPDERVSVMVNEEDHLRMQSIRSGLALDECLADIDGIDDELEKGLDFAFHPRFGYLTACPTNVGTGLRLSVMLHLPGLKLTGELEKASRAAHDMGLAVRGFYGEGSEAAGEFYQVSNQTTLGKSDALLLKEMSFEIIPRLVGYERHARQKLLGERRESTHDAVARALGTLRYARMLRSAEAMDLLGMVRLGVIGGLITDVSLEQVHALLLATQPAHLSRAVRRDLTPQERRGARAGLCRERLGGS